MAQSWVGRGVMKGLISYPDLSLLFLASQPWVPTPSSSAPGLLSSPRPAGWQLLSF